MKQLSRMALAGFAFVGILSGLGCVSKRQFRDNAQSTDTRVSAVEAGVEANEKRIVDLRGETDTKIGAVQEHSTRAMRKAEEAERAARGKILWAVTLSDDKVKFAHDVASVTPEAGGALDQLAATVKEYGKAVYLEIEGHTDSTGPAAYNLVLGEKRAMAVRNYLSQKGGLPLHAMNTISMGENDPIADNSTREGRAKNRRVLVKVLE